MNRLKYLVYQFGLGILMTGVVVAGEMYHSIQASKVQASYLATLEVRRSVDTVIVERVIENTSTAPKKTFSKSENKADKNRFSKSTKAISNPQIQVPIATNNGKMKIDSSREKSTAKKGEAKLVQVDLNKSTPEELKQVRGIGDVFSQRIVKYRDLLGGYYSLSQLSEVYGMDKIDLEFIKKQLICDAAVKKLPINSGDFKTLIRHPYLSKNDVNLILNYRKKHQRISSEEELLKVIPNFKNLEKIRPYLSFLPASKSGEVLASNK